MVYSPHRVTHQFGFDQGMPSAIAIDTNFDACCDALSLDKRNDLYAAVRQMFFPSIRRVGVASPGWLTYWTGCLNAFKQFKSTVVDDNLPESTIYKYEFHYELLKEDKGGAPPLTASLLVPQVRQIKRPCIHEVINFPSLYFFFIIIIIIIMLSNQLFFFSVGGLEERHIYNSSRANNLKQTH